MRWKIIVANASIVLIVGLVAYFLMATSLTAVVRNDARTRTAVAQSVRAANARLALDALQLERWLDSRVRVGVVSDVFAGGTEQARQESATVQATKIRDDAAQNPAFSGLAPSLVLFIDTQGVVLGRNGSTALRGDRLFEIYPTAKNVISEGKTYSDVWISPKRQEQLFVSLAAVRGEGNAIVGAVAVGVPLDDERLRRTSELTSGQVLFFGVSGESGIELVARGGTLPEGLSAQVSSRAIAQTAQASFRARNVMVAETTNGDWVYGIGSLDGYAVQNMALVAVMPTSLVPSVEGLLTPIIWGTLLGLLLVVIVGALIGNYIAQPISELEDGLLAIINGNQTIRFQIEHPDLGGLVFRINSLLNALTGVPEDDTDEQGRPSAAPSPNHFQEALSVDESFILSQQVNPAVVGALAGEPAEAYYRRLFKEYLAAKRQIGDPVDPGAYQGFMAHIQQHEAEISAKHGRPVRYQLEVRDGGVTLVAIPLS
jgi:hypothetical protein